MALAGAELLLYPTAIGWDPNDDQAEKDRQRDAWITVQRGHAVANGLPLLSCNRTGFEADPSGVGAGIQFWGSSFAAGPQGEFLAQAGADARQLLLAEVDLARSEHVRRRSVEHTSELQSLMRSSYADLCLNKKRQPLPRNV